MTNPEKLKPLFQPYPADLMPMYPSHPSSTIPATNPPLASNLFRPETVP